MHFLVANPVCARDVILILVLHAINLFGTIVATGTPISDPVAAPLSTGAVAGIAVGGVVGVLLIVAVVVIIVIVAISARKKRIYRKYVLPYRSYVYGENRASSTKGLSPTNLAINYS